MLTETTQFLNQNILNHLSETKPYLQRPSVVSRNFLILAQTVLFPSSQAEMSNADPGSAWPWRRNHTTAPLPPGPRGVPFFGYLPFLGTNLHRKFAELAETYGPIYKLRLGSKLYVVVNSPSLAKEIVRDQDMTFANRDPNIAAAIASYGVRDIAFSSQGLYWRNLRKLFVRQLMSNMSLDACYGLRRQEVRKALSDLYRKPGVPVDIGELALLILVNMVMGMLWGGTLQGEKGEAVASEFREVVAKLMVLLGSPNVSDFFPALAWLDLQGVERDIKGNNK
ncbi:flavonoid 3'-monooxygenase-like [Eucalyptus grandis]|uniref:flavonoid 3'-monooxygenase-like n=1 Tax=Eucalyptus grandis TaxID=71139 RepID=UPI00192EE118|nr:flavonoid 3'-monooxygenase-like [Eucalyptus grandis]